MTPTTPTLLLSAAALALLTACGQPEPAEEPPELAPLEGPETPADPDPAPQEPDMPESAALSPAVATPDDILTATPAASTSTTEPDSRAFIDRFDRLDESRWYVAEGFTIQEDWFGSAWQRDTILRLAPGLRFEISAVDHDTKKWSGASVQRVGQNGNNDKFSYGRFETIMTAAEGDGLVSAFFTYTGEYFGDEQHEIDFEFLGKDTTKVQLNYYLRGDGEHAQMIDLGYDARDTPNLYAFEWRPGSIKWFIGDVLVHEETGPVDSLPHEPQKIFSQLWAGGPPTANWLGAPVSLDYPIADVFCVSFREHDSNAAQCSDGFDTLNSATPASTVTR